MRECSVSECDRPAKTRGLCGAHAERVRASKSLATPIRPRNADFEAFVDKSGDCWLWTRGLNSAGYGTYSGSYTHRLMHERYVGPIPDGFQVDHLCRNRRCCNPAHLEAVTPQVNTLRSMSPGAIAVRTNRCLRNHEYTPENTYTNPQGYRSCRACSRERQRQACPECGEVRSSLPRHLRLMHHRSAA